jgi:hypothetical protein
VLGSSVQKIRKKQPEPERSLIAYARGNTALKWGRDFIIEILKELREAICGRKNSEQARPQITGYAYSHCGSIMAHLGVSNPTALGLAVLVLLSIGNASKKVFCRNTTPAALKFECPQVG